MNRRQRFAALVLVPLMFSCGGSGGSSMGTGE